MRATSPIFTEKNQYCGINCHLNSQLQVQGWEEFHTRHIADVCTYLSKQIGETGYVANLAASFQIRGRKAVQMTQNPIYHIPTSDSMIVHPEGVAAMVHNPRLYPIFNYFEAVAIRLVDTQGMVRETPAVWIELLTPSNKQGGRYYKYYLRERERALQAGAAIFVEIDYLHESPSTIHEYPDYSQQAEASTPYRIIVADTREHRRIPQGELYIANFGVDEAIPEIPIPLAGNSIVPLDLNTVYNHTYREAGYGTQDGSPINYRQAPVNIDRYSPADQRRIMDRLQTIQIAYEAAVGLEAGKEPLPIDQQQLAHWRQQHHIQPSTYPISSQE